LFGICVVSTAGQAYTAGDADRAFTIMSVSKPFVFALACERLGPAALRDRVGVNGTGLPFNSLAAVEASPDGRTNPMVSSGAIATTGLVGDWAAIHDGLSRFAGRPLLFDEAVHASAAATNHRSCAPTRRVRAPPLSTDQPPGLLLRQPAGRWIRVGASEPALACRG
jgi:glutaminase